MPYPRFRINMSLIELPLFFGEIFTKVGEKSVSEFAEAFRQFGGFENVVLAESGRSGFRLLLKTLDFEPGSEIIFPAYTFHPIPVAAAECGVTPVFVDVDPATWNIRPESILPRITNKTRAIVPTHLFGVPAPMEKILAISREHNLFVIEDCAHALGATYREKMVGNWGDATIFTFAMSKNLPCWGGGAVVVNDPELAERMGNRIKSEAEPSSFSILRRQFPNILAMLLTQRVIFPWTLYPVLRIADILESDIFDRPFLEPVVPPRLHTRKRLAVSGEQLKENSKQLAVSGKRLPGDRDRLRLTAYRSPITTISPLQAATGLRQLRRFPDWLERQINNAHHLRRRLYGCSKLQLQQEPPDTQSSFLYLRARVEEPVAFRRALLRRGVDTKPDDMRNCAALGIFKERPECPNAERLGRHCIELPCSHFYSEREIDDIADRVQAAVKDL